jgi:hypothetical protein
MQMGIYNSCLLDWDLDRFLSWAAQHGYAGVELHGGPRFRHVDWDAVANGRQNPLVEAQMKYPVRVYPHSPGATRVLRSNRTSSATRIG